MTSDLIHLTSAAHARVNAWFKRMHQNEKRLVLALVENSDVGITQPISDGNTGPTSDLTVRFPGPWLGLCGYRSGDIDTWETVSLLGTQVSIQPGLLKRLHGHIIDEMTVCDPVSGLSHTGLYLRER